MFALNPGGSGDGNNSGGNSTLSFVQQQLYFFGVQLGLYFVAIRGAYMLFSYRDERQRSIEN